MTLTRQQRQNRRSNRELTSREYLERRRRYSDTTPSVRNLRHVLKRQSDSEVTKNLPKEWKDKFIVAHASRLRTWLTTYCAWQTCETLFTLARADKARENRCKLENQLRMHRTTAYFIQHHLPLKVTLVYRRYRRQQRGREREFYRCIKEYDCRVRHQRTGGLRLIHPTLHSGKVEWDTITTTGLCEGMGDPLVAPPLQDTYGHVAILCSRDLLLPTRLDHTNTVTFSTRRRVLTTTGHVCTLRVFGELQDTLIPLHRLLKPLIGPCVSQVLGFLV